MAKTPPELQTAETKPTATSLFQKLLKENNLIISLEEPQIRFTKDGAVIIEKPILRVNYGK